MPTTVPLDAPTWFIVLEYLKLIFSPAFVVTCAALVLLCIYFWTYQIRPIGLRCNATYSQLIDTTAVIAGETIKRIDEGKFTDEEIKQAAHEIAKVMQQLAIAKDLGQRSRLSVILKDAMAGLFKSRKAKNNPPPPTRS